MADTASGTASGSVSVTTITTTSVSITTSPTTTIIVTDTSTSSLETSSVPPTTSIITTSEPPSTTVVTPTSTPPTVINVTATTTLTPPPATTTPIVSPTVVVVTSTREGETSVTTTRAVDTTSNTSPTPSRLSASGTASGSGSGLNSGAKIAIAVIIPIVVIAAAFLIGFFLWRKRKARKNNEELRKNEMAEYGFNPNSDPTLVGAAGTAYTDTVSEAPEDNSGYRGWGATSSNRKASTTLGSNGKAAAGLAMSESSSQPGGYHGSPNTGSDAYSTDPLMNGHPESGDGVAALGGAAGLHRNRSGAAGIRRGPSNASSTYSEGHVSEVSSDNHSNNPGPYYQEEVPYNIYNDAAPSHGPYGDGSYGGTGNQPVIRDVQARRNTRIERAPTFPQTQGGISQNF